MRDERESNVFQQLLGYDPYGPPKPAELALRDKATRVLDWQNWKLEDGALVPIGKLAAGLPPQLIQLEKDLKTEYNQIGDGPRRTMISGLLRSLDQVREVYINEGKNGLVLRAMADAAGQEQRQVSLRSAYEKQLSQDADLRAQLTKDMQAYVLEQRGQFEEAIKNRPAAEQEQLKKQAPWLFGDAGNLNDPAFKYISPQVQFTADGDPVIGFAPTAALQRLQLEQSLAMGLYRVNGDEGPFFSRLGSSYGGAPLTAEGSRAWLASEQIGGKTPQNIVQAHGPLRPGVVSDDFPIQLAASFMVAGPLGPMALSMSAGRMAGSMALDLALNVSLEAATEYATKRYGAEGGLAANALILMGTLLTRRAITSPRLKAMLKTVWKDSPASYCFVAGTPLLTPDGDKAIEQFRPGDLILSRSEYNVDGPVEVKVVEEVFAHEASVMPLVVKGRVVRTTPEHPFYVLGKGWRRAKELRVGDWLVSHEGMPVQVEQVGEPDEVTTVYNLRVADYHTYFVGCEEWGFSVWAHNRCEFELVPKGDKWVVRDYTKKVIKEFDNYEAALTHTGKLNSELQVRIDKAKTLTRPPGVDTAARPRDQAVLEVVKSENGEVGIFGSLQGNTSELHDAAVMQLARELAKSLLGK